MKQAVIFDLDGTLADTLQDLADSMNAVLADQGRSTHPVEAYRYFVGEGMTTLVRRALGNAARDPALVRQVEDDMRRRYAEHQYDTTRLYDGVPALLDALRDRGIRLAVLSNKPHEFTREMVARLCDEDRFEVIQGHAPDTALKPDPAAALRIVEQMDLPRESFLYVGDTNTDMQTARAAGLLAVGVTWGFRPEDELRASGAQAIVHAPLDLLALLTD